MFSKNKGTYGYLGKQRTKEILTTVILFGISLSLYFAGLITTHTNKNLLTLVAVLGCLPASRSAVSMIMYLRAKGCSQQVYDMVEGIPIEYAIKLYDLYLTSYKHNFQVSSFVILNKNLVGLTEDEKFAEKEAKEHLQNMFAKSGMKDMTIKIFTDPAKYEERLLSLSQAGLEELSSLQKEAKELVLDLSL